MEVNKVYRHYVSTTWRDRGGLVWWIDECEVEPRIEAEDGRKMAWVSDSHLTVVGNDWCASKSDCEREVVRILRARAQEILAQADELERNTAGH